MSERNGKCAIAAETYEETVAKIRARWQARRAQIDPANPNAAAAIELGEEFERWEIEDAAMTDEEIAEAIDIMRSIDKHRSRKLFADVTGEAE